LLGRIFCVSPRDLDAWQLALDEADAELRAREHEALDAQLTDEERRALAAERDKLATDRDALADARDESARARDIAALARDVGGSARDRAARKRTKDMDEGFGDRSLAGVDRDFAAGDRSDSVDDRRRSAQARRDAAGSRQRAADDREAAARRNGEVQREIDGLKDALESRLCIGQAEGLLMARHSLDADAAFRLLVKLSQYQHMKLREVAAELVADAERQ
jgi:hypothetical protein